MAIIFLHRLVLTEIMGYNGLTGNLMVCKL